MACCFSSMRLESRCRVSDVSSMTWYQLPSPFVTARFGSETRLPPVPGLPGFRLPKPGLPARRRSPPETRTRLGCSRATAVSRHQTADVDVPRPSGRPTSALPAAGIPAASADAGLRNRTTTRGTPTSVAGNGGRLQGGQRQGVPQGCVRFAGEVSCRPGPDGPHGRGVSPAVAEDRDDCVGGYVDHESCKQDDEKFH